MWSQPRSGNSLKTPKKTSGIREVARLSCFCAKSKKLIQQLTEYFPRWAGLVLAVKRFAKRACKLFKRSNKNEVNTVITWINYREFVFANWRILHQNKAKLVGKSSEYRSRNVKDTKLFECVAEPRNLLDLPLLSCLPFHHPPAKCESLHIITLQANLPPTPFKK